MFLQVLATVSCHLVTTAFLGGVDTEFFLWSSCLQCKGSLTVLLPASSKLLTCMWVEKHTSSGPRIELGRRFHLHFP